MTPEVETRLTEMREALAERGISMTSRRAKLLEVLVSSEHHPSVSEIHQDIKRYYPGTSLATVYNTIELLKETGQVLEIEFSGSANRYDGRRPTPHPHLVCIECERIDDLDIVESDEALEEVSRTTGFKVVSKRTDYYGVCPDCQTKSDNPQT